MGDNLLTRQEARELAEAAADVAVTRTFALFGVDVHNQTSINEFRADLVSAKQMRKLRETASSKFWVIIITAGCIAIGSVLVDTLRYKYPSLFN